MAILTSKIEDDNTHRQEPPLHLIQPSSPSSSARSSTSNLMGNSNIITIVIIMRVMISKDDDIKLSIIIITKIMIVSLTKNSEPSIHL